VDALPEPYFALSNNTYRIHEMNASTIDDKGIYIGDVTAKQGTTEKILLTFANSVNLEEVKQIQYEIIKSVGTSVISATVDVGDNDPLKIPLIYNDTDRIYTFELPPSVTEAGLYSITLRFYAENHSYINQQRSLYYYR
jgi:hypothetical protein